MSKIFKIIIFLFIANPIFAENTIIIFGENKVNAEKIKKIYGNELNEFATNILNEFNRKELKDNKKLKNKEIAFLKRIKQEFNYLYANVEVNFKPSEPGANIFLEVIDQKQPERMHLLVKNTSANSLPIKRKNIIDEMIYYQYITNKKISSNRFSENKQKCENYFCGFDTPEFKILQEKFKKDVTPQKDLILKTLIDANPQRKTAAIALLGFFKDPQEIINLASAHVLDQEQSVRDMALTVTLQTLGMSKITNINVKPYIELLSAPQDADRNMSLIVLLQAASNPNAAKVIINEGKKPLLDFLHSDYKNYSSLAYLILKELSGKNFAENDFKNWEKWLQENSNV